MGHSFRSRRDTARRRWRSIVRVVAFVFLVITAVDLTSPQFCGEETAPLFRAPHAGATIDVDAHPQPPVSSREDCFCCCSHVVHVGLTARVSSPAISGAIVRATAPQVPFTTSRALFHPPRLV